MGKCASGQMAFTSTLAQLLVVCTLLTLWRTTSVAADECGTKFTDPTSSTVLAQVVMQGAVRGLNPMPGHAGSHSANVTVGKVYKGIDVLRRVSPTADMVMVSEFGQEDKDRCVASMEEMNTDEMHIFFLRQTSDRNLLQMSAMPLLMEKKMERRVRRSLCDTCVRPPTIKRVACKNCAKEPKIKDMKPKKVKIGKRARLRCVARAKPPPTFSWHKSGLPIVSGSGGITVKDKTSSSTIIIRRFTRAYKGLYTCIARNEIGETEKTVYLDIQEQQKEPKKKKEKHQENNAHGRATCETNICLNGGSCYFSLSGLQTCVCVEGWAGSRCEILDEDISENISNNTENTDRSNTIPRQPTETRSETDPKRRPQSETVHNTVAREQRPSPSSSSQNSTGSHIDASGSAGLDAHTAHAHSQSSSSKKTMPSVINPLATGASRAHIAEEQTDVSLDEDTNENIEDDEDEVTRELSPNDLSRLRSRLKKSRLKVVYCKDKRYCKNGGRCRYVSKLNVKFCECPEGFEGQQCEILSREI